MRSRTLQTLGTLLYRAFPKGSQGSKASVWCNSLCPTSASPPTALRSLNLTSLLNSIGVLVVGLGYFGVHHSIGIFQEQKGHNITISSNTCANLNPLQPCKYALKGTPKIDTYSYLYKTLNPIYAMPAFQPRATERRTKFWAGILGII